MLTSKIIRFLPVLVPIFVHSATWAAPGKSGDTTPLNPECRPNYDIQAKPGRCSGWAYGYNSNPTSPEFMWLQANFSKRICDIRFGVGRCYWSKSLAACDAWVAWEESRHTNASDKPFKKYHKPLGRPPGKEGHQCSYGYKGAVKQPGETYQFATNTRFTASIEPAEYCERMVEGPYKNCSEAFRKCNTDYGSAQSGFEFTEEQKQRVRATNRGSNQLPFRSDLAGFVYPKGSAPCAKPHMNDPSLCVEPDTLSDSSGSSSGAQVHHVIPKKDIRGCNCGSNSMKNAALISRQLNRFLSNSDRPRNEITHINERGMMNPYMTCRSP